MTVTEKYIEFILNSMEKETQVQLWEPKEGNSIAIHKFGPAVRIPVKMEVLQKYTRSVVMMISFDKYKIENIFFMPMNQSPEGIFNKIDKELHKIVNRAFMKDGREDEVREMYVKRREVIAKAIAEADLKYMLNK